MTRRRHTALFGLLTAVLSTAPVQAQRPPVEVVEEAVTLCRETQLKPAAERAALWDRGAKLARTAIAADAANAAAHFALFCNLGMQAQHAGLSLWALAMLPRMRFEIDQALLLSPDYSEALAGKGAFLFFLPRLLGGDPEEGERLLRAGLARDESNALARLILAKVLVWRGRRAEGLAEAEHAWMLLTAAGRDAEAARARAFMGELEALDDTLAHQDTDDEGDTDSRS